MTRSFIDKVLKHASAIAKKKIGKVLSMTKSGDNNQVLTQADLEIGSWIVAQIQKHYPGHDIIDEEAGGIDNGSEYTWVIDPIDGTSNFAAGSQIYAIMIGLLKDDKPILGGVAIPAFNEIYYGEQRKGAWCNNKKISVTKETNLLKALVAYQIDGHQEHPEMTREECRLLAEIVLKIRNLRTTGCGLDTMMVADGRYGAYLNQTGKIWDNVAHHIIIEEAGGIFTDFFGNPMDYRYPLTKIGNNFTSCAASPALHRKLQKIIHDSK